MSGGYASRLSDYTNKGICGLPEIEDTKRTLTLKLPKLVTLIQEYAPNVIVLTGAGISTSAGIPDFRGPNGIWTKEQQEKVDKDGSNNKKKKRKRQQNQQKQQNQEAELKDFTKAKPTLCHYAITDLINMGIVSYCITQNVDGLHKVTGISRNNYSAMHGCVRTEKCSNKFCQTEYFRDYDIGGMSFQPTGRYCDVCNSSTEDDGNEDGSDSSNVDGGECEREKFGTTTTKVKLEKNDEKNIEGILLKKDDDDDDDNGDDVKKPKVEMNNISNNVGSNGNSQEKDLVDSSKQQATASKLYPLHDTLLDWDDPLPEDDFEYIQNLVEKPNTLVLCLGTSLRIEPIGLLPTQATEFVIVNLQKTPRDEHASLIIRANVDLVMEYVMKHINVVATKDAAVLPSAAVDEQNGSNYTSYLTNGAGRPPPPQIERVWTPPPSRLNLAEDDEEDDD